MKPPSAGPSPRRIEAICLPPLSKKRDGRYASAADLAREVDLLEAPGTRRREELAASQAERRRRSRWKDDGGGQEAHAQADA